MSSADDIPVTLRPASGTFDFKGAPPFAAAYLRTYYMQPPTADETAVARFLIEEFRERPPSGSFLELGCGPTVHHVFPFAPHVDSIVLADYLDENLDAVRRWLARAPGAHDWSQYAALSLALEAAAATPAAIAEREALARSKVHAVEPCDLKAPPPAAACERFDAVGAFYCVEEVGIAPAEWRRVLGNACAHVKPGGRFFMAALADMDGYEVRGEDGRTHVYPCAIVTEGAVEAALVELGFGRGELRLQRTEIEHPDCGVTGAIVVAATKTARLP